MCTCVVALMGALVGVRKHLTRLNTDLNLHTTRVRLEIVVINIMFHM